jgi:hypothetical protein
VRLRFVEGGPWRNIRYEISANSISCHFSVVNRRGFIFHQNLLKPVYLQSPSEFIVATALGRLCVSALTLRSDLYPAPPVAALQLGVPTARPAETVTEAARKYSRNEISANVVSRRCGIYCRVLSRSR